MVDRYVGYYEPYAISHDELDREVSFTKRFETRPARWLGQLNWRTSGDFRGPITTFAIHGPNSGLFPVQFRVRLCRHSMTKP